MQHNCGRTFEAAAVQPAVDLLLGADVREVVDVDLAVYNSTTAASFTSRALTNDSNWLAQVSFAVQPISSERSSVSHAFRAVRPNGHAFLLSPLMLARLASRAAICVAPRAHCCQPALQNKGAPREAWMSPQQSPVHLPPPFLQVPLARYPTAEELRQPLPAPSSHQAWNLPHVLPARERSGALLRAIAVLLVVSFQLVKARSRTYEGKNPLVMDVYNAPKRDLAGGAKSKKFAA